MTIFHRLIARLREAFRWFVAIEATPIEELERAGRRPNQADDSDARRAATRAVINEQRGDTHAVYIPLL